MTRSAVWLTCVWIAAATWGGLDAACVDDDPRGNATLACQGERLLWRWLDSPEGLRLSDGVRLVRVADDETAARNMMDDDGGLLGKAARFAASHELRVRLSEVLPAPEDLLAGRSAQGTGRGKNKGGGGMAMVAAMAMMMKGVLGAVGLGGAALLAMKALMVSMMALMLSAIVGVKKLASGHDDGGTHHVQVVPVHHAGGEHHYRRRRSHPYAAYGHLAARK